MKKMIRPGPCHLGNARFSFTVWAPLRKSVALRLSGDKDHTLPLTALEGGYWHGEHDGVTEQTRYSYILDNELERPDPASPHQPEGVHKPSAVVDHAAFSWSDQDYKSMPLADMILYELHVGTFTPQGTFDAVIPRLDALCDLGVNALSLMPVAQFPGARNWGYDGVHPYAVQNSYGGPHALKRLVDACHARNMAVVLDVVYNHLGPEGNYLRDFGPYFTDRYHTPWGEALNFDGPFSDEVRRYFIHNALFWFEHYHIDGLRLDAVHAIYDHSAVPFLQQLAEEADSLGDRLDRPCLLIAESDLNDARLIRSSDQGGFGLSAQWSDDFHHALHTLLTGEDRGYYVDFGTVDDLTRAHEERYVYARRYSRFRKRFHGNQAWDLPPDRFVICAQNHDQVGNRMLGERLTGLVSFEALKLAAAAVLHAPFVPMLFMGEEYAESAPFLYFISHGDRDLVDAVRNGRKKEFAGFVWQGEPPDPQDAATFTRSRLGWQLRHTGEHAIMLAWHRELIRWRQANSVLKPSEDVVLTASAVEDAAALLVTRLTDSVGAFSVLHFARTNGTAEIKVPEGTWHKVIDSANTAYNGGGPTMPDVLSGDQSCDLPPFSYTLYLTKDKT